MTDEPDPVEKLAQRIAERHVAKQREEMRDPAKVAAWGDDAKAAEFAEGELEAALEELTGEKPTEPDTSTPSTEQ